MLITNDQNCLGELGHEPAFKSYPWMKTHSVFTGRIK